MTEGWSITLPVECLQIVLSLKSFVKGKEKSNAQLGDKLWYQTHTALYQETRAGPHKRKTGNSVWGCSAHTPLAPNAWATARADHWLCQSLPLHGQQKLPKIAVNSASPEAMPWEIERWCEVRTRQIWVGSWLCLLLALVWVQVN